MYWWIPLFPDIPITLFDTNAMRTITAWWYLKKTTYIHNTTTCTCTCTCFTFTVYIHVLHWALKNDIIHMTTCTSELNWPANHEYSYMYCTCTHHVHWYGYTYILALFKMTELVQKVINSSCTISHIEVFLLFSGLVLCGAGVQVLISGLPKQHCKIYLNSTLKIYSWMVT